jgi:magnesium chelatase subunit I
MTSNRPSTVGELKASGYEPRTVKDELRQNLIAKLKSGEDIFPGIIGFDDTVVPMIVNAILARHDFILLGLRGQAKSRILRQLVGMLDLEIPILAGSEINDDPLKPISKYARMVLEERGDDAPLAWVNRDNRFVEKLATPDVTIGDIIGDVDPIKAARGGHILADEMTIHYGLLPRANRGIFAMNELPDLDDLVQVGLFNILEERDVQIRGYPVAFEIDVSILFSANPATYNRSGKVIPQLKDRIGTTVVTHYPRDRDLGMQITIEQAAEDGIDELADRYPVLVPRFMAEVVEQMAISARESKWIDQSSGVSARFSIANYKTMISSARRRAIMLAGKGEPSPAVPRISDLAHFHGSAIGKIELDMMGTHQMSEEQVLDSILADAIKTVFEEYVDQHGLGEIAELFAEGVRIEVGDMLPSTHYVELLKRVPPAWEKAFEVNAAEDPAVRASCVEFILAGLWASDRISRGMRHGQVEYVI